MRYILLIVLLAFLGINYSTPEVPLEQIVISHATDAYKQSYDQLGHLDYEKAEIYFLDENDQVLQIARVSQGLPNGIHYVPWELVVPLRMPAQTQTIYLVHNHPGGNPKLSVEDIKTGQFWGQWAHQKGIKFDLLAITASSGYTSLLEQGFFTPDEQEYGFFDLLTYLVQPGLAMASDSLHRVLFNP